MRGAIITHPGLEAVAGKEVKELLGIQPSLQTSVALFDTDESQDFMTLSYRSQSAIKVLHLFLDAPITSLDDVLPQIKEYDFSPFTKDAKFAVRSMIVNNDLLDTMETEREVGGIIHDSTGAKVDLENPDITFFVYIFEDQFYLGIDYAGFDLSKRSYRLFCQSDSVKGTIAYSLVRLGSYSPDMVLVDPFAQSGTVAIEAVHFATGRSPHYFSKDKFAFQHFPHLKGIDFEGFMDGLDDKIEDVDLQVYSYDSQQRHVRAAEKNAKVAAVNKLIKFSRTEVEWLDTKFEKDSVDCIVTNPPRPSVHNTSEALEKAFQEFFYTSNFILKPEGKIVFLGKNYPKILALAQRYHFVLKANYEVWQGKELFNILIFVKE